MSLSSVWTKVYIDKMKELVDTKKLNLDCSCSIFNNTNYSGCG